MPSQHTHTKKIVTKHISFLKLISMRWNSRNTSNSIGSTLCLHKHLINSKPRSSCRFSDSWINGLWAPLLPSNPLVERIIKNTFLNYSYFSIFFSLKRSEQELSSFLSQKKIGKKFSPMVVRKKKSATENYRKITYLSIYSNY